MSTTRRTPVEASCCVVTVPPVGTNLVVVRGVLSREPERREMRSGDVLVTYEVTVRPVPDGGAPARSAETLPVCWFDPPAAATRFDAADDVVVVGRVRRRFYRSGGVTASRTEVVAARVVSARAPARVRAALAPVLGTLVAPG